MIIQERLLQTRRHSWVEVYIYMKIVPKQAAAAPHLTSQLEKLSYNEICIHFQDSSKIEGRNKSKYCIIILKTHLAFILHDSLKADDDMD